MREQSSIGFWDSCSLRRQGCSLRLLLHRSSSSIWFYESGTPRIATEKAHQKRSGKMRKHQEQPCPPSGPRKKRLRGRRWRSGRRCSPSWAAWRRKANDWPWSKRYVSDSLHWLDSIRFDSFTPSSCFFARQELEAMADPTRKEVSAIRKKIDAVNRELKPLGHNCLKKVKTSNDCWPSVHPTTAMVP